MMKIKDSKKKIIWLITVIALITIILGSVIIRNTVMNQEAKEGNQLAGANQNSELIANNIKKGVTIGGVTGTLETLDTSDATATPDKIFKGETAYVNGKKITGTYEEQMDAEIEGIKIPKGFYYVGGIKDSGIVISDNKADENKYSSQNYSDQANIPADGLIGNQFVWVPVENMADFNRYSSYDDGKIQSVTDYYEPAQENYNYETELEDYYSMIKSVRKNKGFFVARFEAGKENINGVETVVSKKGATVWNSIIWGTSTNTPGTKGAVAKAQNMYTNKNGYDVTSTLIYGIQWDTIMAWIDPAYKTSTCADNSFAKNSTGKGNYSGSIAKCGSSDNYRIKNIYDLAGNVEEWTLETAYNGSRSFRVVRGGSYNLSASESPASRRAYPSLAGIISDSYGFRVAIYL